MLISGVGGMGYRDLRLTELDGVVDFYGFFEHLRDGAVFVLGEGDGVFGRFLVNCRRRFCRSA